MPEYFPYHVCIKISSLPLRHEYFPFKSALRFLTHRHHHIKAAPVTSRKSYFSSVHKSLPSLYALYDTNIFPITSALRFLIHRHHHIIAAPMTSCKIYFSNVHKSLPSLYALYDTNIFPITSALRFFNTSSSPHYSSTDYITQELFQQRPQIAPNSSCPLRHEHFRYHVRINRRHHVISSGPARSQRTDKVFAINLIPTFTWYLADLSGWTDGVILGTEQTWKE